MIGWYNESLPRWLEHHGNMVVAFLHIDCDIYSSAAYVLSALESRLAKNAVIVFDELINYPEYAQHELKALLELQARTRRTVTVLGAGAPRLLGRTPQAIRAALKAQNGERQGHQSVAVVLV